MTTGGFAPERKARRLQHDSVGCESRPPAGHFFSGPGLLGVDTIVVAKIAVEPANLFSLAKIFILKAKGH